MAFHADKSISLLCLFLSLLMSSCTIKTVEDLKSRYPGKPMHKAYAEGTDGAGNLVAGASWGAKSKESAKRLALGKCKTVGVGCKIIDINGHFPFSSSKDRKKKTIIKNNQENNTQKLLVTSDKAVLFERNDKNIKINKKILVDDILSIITERDNMYYVITENGINGWIDEEYVILKDKNNDESKLIDENKKLKAELKYVQNQLNLVSNSEGKIDKDSKPTEIKKHISPSIIKTKTVYTNFPIEIRTKPFFEGDLVKTLKTRTKLKVTGEKDGWYQISTSEGKSGWVAKKWTTSDNITITSEFKQKENVAKKKNKTFITSVENTIPKSRKLLVGLYYDNLLGIDYTMKVFSISGEYVIEYGYDDGSTEKKQCKSYQTSRGMKLVESENSYGDYYLLTNSGNLEQRDSEGLIDTLLNKLPKNELIEKTQKKQTKESCFSLGKRYGRCATLVLKGRTCPPEDDFVLPDRCKGRVETQNGIEAGVRAIW